MDLHFRAFSFVDRIETVGSDTRIVRGFYQVPAGLSGFPPSLVAEAVGQLAAWVAMKSVDFKRRPVAGLAGSIDLLAPVKPGDCIALTAELESVDEEAVAYAGSAAVDGVPVVRLRDCVGPMVPLEEFDDPAQVRERHALLAGPGRTPGGFTGVPALSFTLTGGEPGHAHRATLDVPASADFFADHFPRRPVFPGTLLMHCNLELAGIVAAAIPAPAGHNRWSLGRIADVKLREFTPPGERLDLQACLESRENHPPVLKVESRKGKRLVGSARVHLAATPPS
jgi:3-hydroxymyristoyl/3-hydroxydecanoyl-(acyl carrier protein) dehydratase